MDLQTRVWWDLAAGQGAAVARACALTAWRAAEGPTCAFEDGGMFHVKPRPWMTRMTDHERFFRERLCRERIGTRRVNVEVADDARDGRAQMFHVKRVRAKAHSARRLLLVCLASRRRGRHGGGRVGHGCSFVQRRPLRARTQGRASSRWRVMNGARSPHGCMYMLGKEDRSPHVVGEGP
jgi:hypothetical protein